MTARRIAFVTPGFCIDDDDWCVPVLTKLAVAMNERHQVSIYALSHPPHARRYRAHGLKVCSSGDARAGKWPAVRRMRRLSREIASDHRAANFDVLHAFWPDSGGVVGWLTASRLRIPWLVSGIGGELIEEQPIAYGKRRRTTGKMAAFVARRAANFNVGSSYHRDRIQNENPGLRPTVITTGVDTAMFSRAGDVEALAGEFPVLMAASLVPVKGHDWVIRAFAIAAQTVPGLHLHLIGDGPLRSNLIERARIAGVTERVTFHGQVKYERMPALYRGAAFCVLGSYFENIAMVIPEAAACGRITAGSAVGILPDLCPPDWQTSAGDTEALAQTIVELAQQTELRRLWETRAEQTVLDSMTLDKSVEQFSAAYEALLREGRASR